MSAPQPSPAACSQCGGVAKPGQRYCKSCHAAYMRFWRRHGRLSEEQQAHHLARVIARVNQRRGVLVQEPCAECGSPESEKHHPDYEQPLLVIWLCRSCHHAFHMKQFHAPAPRRSVLKGEIRSRAPYWTVRRSQSLRQLWSDPALNIGQIAKRLRVSRTAVLGKAERMGLGRRPRLLQETGA